MSFNPANLTLVGLLDGGRRVFDYSTGDNKATAKQSNYWEGDENDPRATSFVSPGDILQITASDGELLAVVGNLNLSQGPGATFRLTFSLTLLAEGIATFHYPSLLP
jgi:hypothetical protein